MLKSSEELSATAESGYSSLWVSHNEQLLLTLHTVTSFTVKLIILTREALHVANFKKSLEY